MARKLRRMQIQEISVVDRGAGSGTRIVLRKREMEGNVDQATAVRKRVSKRAEALVAAGVAKSFDGAVAHLAYSLDSEDQKLWRSYKYLDPLPTEPAPAPPMPVISSAYEKIMAKAQKRLKKHPELQTIAKAFSDEYCHPTNDGLVAQALTASAGPPEDAGWRSRSRQGSSIPADGGSALPSTRIGGGFSSLPRPAGGSSSAGPPAFLQG